MDGGVCLLQRAAVSDFASGPQGHRSSKKLIRSLHFRMLVTTTDPPPPLTHKYSPTPLWMSETPHRLFSGARTPVIKSGYNRSKRPRQLLRKRDAERSAVTRGECAQSLPEQLVCRTAWAGDKRVQGQGSGAGTPRHEAGLTDTISGGEAGASDAHLTPGRWNQGVNPRPRGAGEPLRFQRKTQRAACAPKKAGLGARSGHGRPSANRIGKAGGPRAARRVTRPEPRVLHPQPVPDSAQLSPSSGRAGRRDPRRAAGPPDGGEPGPGARRAETSPRT